MNQYLLSEGDVLERIKRFQIRSQAIPLAIVIISFVLALGFGNNILLLMLALAGALLYANAFMTHRFRQRILQPEANSIYAPISGKMQAFAEQGNIQKITLRKSVYDPVEIRCPMDGCHWEADELVLNNPQFRLSFSAKRIFRITDARMKAGEVIALMIGPGSCEITMPKSLHLLIKKGSSCQAGESRICILDDVIQA